MLVLDCVGVEMLGIKNTIIVTQNSNRDIVKGDILVDGSKIISIGKDVAKDADDIFDGSDFVALPGFINTHTHAPMNIMRGFADDMFLQEWLEQKIWPAEARISRESVYYGALHAELEMLLSGTTCFQDMYFFADAVCETVDKIGMRCVPGGIFLDVPTVQSQSAQEYYRFAKEWINTWKNHPRIKPNVAPHAPYTCNEETLELAVKLAEKFKLNFQIHVSETQKEVNDIKQAKGKTPFSYLHDAGVLRKGTVAIHAVWPEQEDIALLKEVGGSVSHNPVSNMKLSVGKAAPVLDYLKENIPVGLGTDSVVSNNSLDMFSTMKFCSLLHKFVQHDPTMMPAQTTLDLATCSAARALGMEDSIGSIEAGKEADIILLNKKDIGLTPLHNIVSSIVYSVNGSCVDTVFVAGKAIVKHRKILTEDASFITKKTQEIGSYVISGD